MANPFVRFWRSLPRGGALLLLALVFLPRVLAAAPDVADRERGQKGKRGNAALQQALDFEILDVNSILFIVDNAGILGQDPRTGNGFGFFPAGSPNLYVFGGGLWVGGLLNGGKIVSTTYDASLGSSEFAPGRIDGSGGGDILCSDNDADLANWYPEFADPATGEPIVFSQRDCIVIINDSNPLLDVQTPIGLEIRQRTMVFTFGLLSRVIFVVWDVVNKNPSPLQEAFLGVNFDMDIGDQFTDDRCAAIPSVPPGANNPTETDVQTNLGFCWDDDFNETNFDPNPPGFVGITFFQGPVNDEGVELGLTRFTLTSNPNFVRPCPDPDADAQQYDQLAGIGTRAPCLDPFSTDMRFIEISGPITFDPNETQRVVVGILFANVSAGRRELEVDPTRCFPQGLPCFLPDPNDPALEELIQIQRAAQVIFNAGFVAPAPPPKPDITLIPGDQQVTIVWNDVSQAPDPFFPIASNPDPENAAFDPLFREFDFEGYTVVRSTNPTIPGNIDTLAIFDIANEVTVIQDTLFQFFPVGDSLLELPAVLFPPRVLPNQGVSFAFTDDNAGQGLINGIVYFYDVVPFDFNPSETLSPPASLATPSLSAGIAFPRDQSVRPRSDASSFQQAGVRFEALTATDEICDAEEATATVDSISGAYVDLIDCSNAIIAQLAPARGLALPRGEFFFVIDSIVPSPTNPYPSENSDTGEPGYEVAFGFNTVWFHWEDASGNLASVIQPNVGSFEQPFDFNIAAQTGVPFSLDTNLQDVGPDLGISLLVGSTFSSFEDLEVNGQSLALLKLGGTKVEESRPHRILDSALADTVDLGFLRFPVDAFREYTQAGPYAPGSVSYQLTWQASDGALTGTLVKLPKGEVVPQGGQPKGPDNPSTPADFVAGYNWGFITGPDPTSVRDAIYPQAAPLTNTISLAPGASFGIFVPGHSIYIGGLKDVPDDGEVWTFRIVSGSSPQGHGREPTAAAEGANPETSPITGPFRYRDNNDGTAPLFETGIVNLYPGARWRLTVAAGSNDPLAADLERIKVVPNPYVANTVWDFSQDNQRIEFINLPPVATIRIYTISGNLVRVLEHASGSGTEAWDLRTRFNLKAATGHYYWLVTTPEGKKKLGLLSIIQNALGAS